MALATVSERQGLTRSENGHSIIFAGTADQIIGAGLAREDQLPGAAGRGKYSATYYAGDPVRSGRVHPYDEKYLSIRKKAKDKFEVVIGYSEVEQMAWFEAEDRSIQQKLKRDAYGKAKVIADRELAFLNVTQPQFVAHTLDRFQRMIEVHISMLGASEYSGYSYSPKTINDMRVAAMGLLAVLKRGDVVFDKKTYDARDKAIKDGLAKLDPARPALRLVRNA